MYKCQYKLTAWIPYEAVGEGISQHEGMRRICFAPFVSDSEHFTVARISVSLTLYT